MRKRLPRGGPGWHPEPKPAEEDAMPIKMLAAALALVAGLAPALARAECGNDRHAQMSCADGQSWDAATRKCVTVGS